MKLSFDGITLGQTKNYGISDIQGLSGDLRNINIEIPDSDFSRNITDRLEPKVRTFSGVLVGDDAEDFRERKRAIANRLRNTYTFTLEDSYQQNGVYTAFETYEFTGKIITIDPNRNFNNTHANYILQIMCGDPLFYKASGTTGEIAILPDQGIHVPVYLPAQFTLADNSFTVTNNGGVNGHLDITLNGAGNVWNILNNSTGLSYTLNYSIADGDFVTINPRPSQAINTVDSAGNSLEEYVLGTYDTFLIGAGESVTYNITVNSGLTASSTVEYGFREPFIAI